MVLVKGRGSPNRKEDAHMETILKATGLKKYYPEIAAMADRVIRIEDGRIVSQ